MCQGYPSQIVLSPARTQFFRLSVVLPYLKDYYVEPHEILPVELVPLTNIGSRYLLLQSYLLMGTCPLRRVEVLPKNWPLICPF